MDDLFHPVTTADIPRLNRAFQEKGSRLCNDSAGAAVLWQEYFEDAAAELCGALVLRERLPGVGHVYSLPMGGDFDAALYELFSLARAQGEPLRLFPVTPEELEALRGCFPELEAELLRPWCDYLYDAQSMVTFAGKKLHGQKNHVNRFRRLYPDWTFEDITAENLPEVRDFFEDHAVRFRKEEETALFETRCVREFLKHYRDYAPLGGVLKASGKVVGFSAGEIVGDTLIIHVEKADTVFSGAYQMLVNEYAKRFVTEGVRYINREEDTGDEGIRQSKESYHPIQLLEKYVITIPQDVTCLAAKRSNEP